MKTQPSFLLPGGRRPVAGSALIITLAVLVLMSIMVISLSDIMRIERGSAHSHLEKARAEMMAEMGTAKVVARLRKETTDTTRNWISEPGQIVASAAGATSKTVIDPPILLTSGKPDQVTSSFATAYLRPAELNVPTFDTVPPNTLPVPPHLISNQEDPNNKGHAVSMPVRWIYVRKDGTEDLSEQPILTDTANPIMGRYAFWTDDESCKVNYNLAWTRDAVNPNPPSHPTKINLPTLFGGDNAAQDKAKALHFFDPTSKQTMPVVFTIDGYRAYSRFFFHTPENARQVAQTYPDIDTALLAAKFNVTHYNHDPDTTFFNEPRIVLTTSPERAGWTLKGTTWVGVNGKPWLNGIYDPTKTGEPIFLNVGAIDPATRAPFTNMWDPIAHVDPTRLADVIERLNRYLQRTDWPIAPANSSFQQKYYSSYPSPANTERLTQISLNIINYVRSKEAAGDPPPGNDPTGRGTATVIPIRGEKKAGAKFVLMEVATSADSYIGITRTPKITEMGLWVDKTPSKVDTATNTYSYPGKAKVEVYLPPNFGLASLNLSKLSWYVNWSPVSGGAAILNSAPEANILTTEVTIPSRGTGNQPKDGIMKAGEYAVVTRAVTVQFTGPRPTTDKDIGLRFAISIVRRLDVCPLGDAAVCTLDSPDVTDPANCSSIEVDDPRVNSYKGDWKKFPKDPAKDPKSTAYNTFGSKNSASTLGQGSNTIPKQDVNKAGAITDISLVMPAPPGTTSGGLSANPTGVMASSGELGYIHTGMESMAKAGVPWRTLHLQPDNTQALPDWAFMDLFTVPADIRKLADGTPDTHARAIYQPHATTMAGRVNMNSKPQPFDLDRKDPLVAVFENATYNATDLTQKLTNTQARAIADAVYNRTLSTGGPVTPGKQYGYQNGYDSPGEVVEMQGVADGGEESEQLVREIANLITARSGVFSVYTVGQAVKQTPTGTLMVTGEQRQQAMVERYTGKDATTGADKVFFRPVFYRSLTP